MKIDSRPLFGVLTALASALFITACAGGGSTGSAAPPALLQPLPAPAMTVTAAQNGAAIVSISSTPGSTVYYTTDASPPTPNSILYSTPLLVSTAQTVSAIATASGATPSAAASTRISNTVASGTLIWSDEFGNSSGLNAAPDGNYWAFDSMATGFKTVNSELEVYCGWASTISPCTGNPNAYVGATDGLLHIVAQQPLAEVYTSARINTAGRLSMTYARIEAMIKLPEGQGFWPAFWLLGNNISQAGWPACGEMDVMEHVNAPVPDWIAGTLHMNGASGASGPTSHYAAAVTSFSASDWHVYGMIWKKGMVQYYVDTPSNIYATYTSSALPAGAVWPFDSGQGRFIILNLAVGGSWPGAPDRSTVFPSEMLVDYVRVYAN